MGKRRWVFFFGFERTDDAEEAEEVSTNAVGYMIEPTDPEGEGWSQDHGEDEEEDRTIGFRRSRRA